MVVDFSQLEGRPISQWFKGRPQLSKRFWQPWWRLCGSRASRGCCGQLPSCFEA